jgi:hypothetical protein
VSLRARSLAVALALAGAALAAPRDAAAAPPTAAPAARAVVILATAVTERDAPGPEDGELLRLAQSLDALLADTAQDLGLEVIPPPPGHVRLGDAALRDRARAAGSTVLLPSLRRISTGEVELRLALADPASRVVDVRSDRVAPADLSVRAVILLRDLVSRRARAAPTAPAVPAPGASTAASIFGNPGRVSLISHATLFGGLVGYSIQRGSGSTDPRLLVPLMVVGAGVGLGASLVASGEWDVDTGDAWYFAAGAWWPSAAGHLIFQGRFAAHRPDSDRWVFGLLGGTTGVALAGLGLALHPMSDGGALMAHSGGAFGLALGALVEMTQRGDIHHTPFSGMGYGAGLGWLAAAAIATQMRAPALRVLAVDAGLAAGGLAGAALGSALLLDKPSPTRQRAWLGITGGSALVGGVVTAIVATPRGKLGHLAGLPIVGVLGESALGSLRAPILGLGYAGSLE